MAGVSNARVIIVKIADRQGRATTSRLVRGIDYAVARGAKIINISFGGTGFSRVERDAILRARKDGVLVVAAAGNGGRVNSPKEYPGAYPHVLAVAATRTDGAAIVDSTKGEQVAIAAPGKRILSTRTRGRYGTRTGTSMAAAVVTGVATRVLAQRRVDPAQLREILVSSARDVGPPGRDDATGWGVVDLSRALITPTPAKDGPEPNDDAALAGELTPLLGPGPEQGASTSATLEQWSDGTDDYRVALRAGDVITITADSLSPTLDVDLAIWKPGAPSFAPGPEYTRDWLAAAALGAGPRETLTYTAKVPGDHSVEARTSAGRGRYTLSVTRTPAPS